MEGITGKKLNQIIAENYPEEYIKEKIGIVNKIKEGNLEQKKAGLLIRAIEENYKNNDMKTEKIREVNEEKKKNEKIETNRIIKNKAEQLKTIRKV